MCLLPQYEQVAITDITKQLQEADLFNKPGILQTVWVLHGLIDKDQTVTIDNVKHKRGATCPIAQETIASMIGVKRRATAHGYLKELIDADIIRVEKASFGGKNCYRYIFTIFDQSAEEPDTCTDTDDENDESVRSDDETCTAQGVHNQYKQEEGPTVSDYPGTNEESEKRGESINDEDRDVQPNTQISKVNDTVEKLTEAKAMNASQQTNESIESFITTFNEAFAYKSDDGFITGWKVARAASDLQGHIEGKLSASSIDMPTLLFFKYCLKETHNRLASGELTEKPRHLNYYREHPQGKEIVELCVKKLRSENQAERSKKQTADWIQETEERKANPDEMPAEAKAELDRLLGRSE